jgi:hypothetical protein
MMEETTDFAALLCYAGGGTRTHTTLRPPDFESGASTDSATPASVESEHYTMGHTRDLSVDRKKRTRQ